MIAVVSRRGPRVPDPPQEMGERDGLAYALFMPAAEPRGGVVILHGAGSCKESHHDFARVALAAGFAAIAFDQRGHGQSDGPMDGRALEDVVSMAGVLRDAVADPTAPIALRGSSMGGYFAILAAPLVAARAVVAICPATGEGLLAGLAAGALGFDADMPAMATLLATHDLHAAVESLSMPLLLLHAEGDEQVPVQHSRELAAQAQAPGSRLIALPGGHHRSIQHDEELQAVSVRWIARALSDEKD